MTADPRHGTGPDRRHGASPDRRPGAGWRGARRELGVAAGMVVSLATAAWALDGPGASGLVLIVCAGASLVVLRTLIGPAEEPPPPEPPYAQGPTQLFAGFWRIQASLTDATKSRLAWDQEARPRLANLLAARLAERHGVSLADDPQSARRLLAGSRHDLWYWIDPARPTPPDASTQPGIPPNVLAALIDQLEQL